MKYNISITVDIPDNLDALLHFAGNSEVRTLAKETEAENIKVTPVSYDDLLAFAKSLPDELKDAARAIVKEVGGSASMKALSAEQRPEVMRRLQQLKDESHA